MLLKLLDMFIPPYGIMAYKQENSMYAKYFHAKYYHVNYYNLVRVTLITEYSALAQL